MVLVWVGPGCVKNSRGETELEPGDKIREDRHDPRQIKIWLRDGRAMIRR
jgi:hypothetical protein